MLQGAVWPIAFGDDMRTDYRLLGNAISVPHALIPLVYACKALKVKGTPDPQEAVAAALHHRLRSTNAVFVPAGSNWVLCHRQQLSSVFAGVAEWAVPGSPPDFAGAFVPWQFSSPENACCIHVATSADPVHVCGLLGLSEAVAVLAPQTAADVTGQTLQVPDLPTLLAQGGLAGQVDSAGLGLVLTSVGSFVVDYHGPLVWIQMLRISDLLGVGKGIDLAVFSLQGRRLTEISDFLPCRIAIAEEPEFQQTPMSMWPSAGDISVDVDNLEQLCVSSRPAAAAELWLAYPFHLMLPIGWSTTVTGFPPVEDTTTTFCSALAPRRLCLPASELRALRRL